MRAKIILLEVRSEPCDEASSWYEIQRSSCWFRPSPRSHAATTGGGGEPVDTSGTECGEDVAGREGACWLIEGSAFSDNEAHQWFRLGPEPQNNAFDGELASGCCEGFATPEAEEDECVRSCIRQMCIEAHALHDEIADSLGECSLSGCGFDDTDCRTGGIFTHHVNLVFPTEANEYSYELDIDCDSTGNQARSEYPAGSGVFVFNWAIGNSLTPPPPTCGASALHPEPEVAPGYNADGGGLSDVLVDWTDSFGGAGTEAAAPDDVKMDYAIETCEAGECLALRSLRLRMPTFSVVEGYRVDDAVMTITPVDTARPTVNHGGVFVFEPGELRAELEFTFDGQRFFRTAPSVTRARGKHRPGHDLLELRRLDFDYLGTLIEATMRVDIRADFENRKPEAEIAPMLEPPYCIDEVRFDAMSVDPDGDPLVHQWSVPDLGLAGTGNEFSALLPPGHHVIVLVSTDDSGLKPGTGLGYDRDCR